VIGGPIGSMSKVPQHVVVESLNLSRSPNGRAALSSSAFADAQTIVQQFISKMSPIKSHTTTAVSTTHKPVDSVAPVATKVPIKSTVPTEPAMAIQPTVQQILERAQRQLQQQQHSTPSVCVCACARWLTCTEVGDGTNAHNRATSRRASGGG
jgi:hypothetical protein